MEREQNTTWLSSIWDQRGSNRLKWKATLSPSTYTPEHATAPNEHSRCPGDPPTPTSLFMENCGECQSAERKVAWAMQTHKNKSSKTLTTKYKLEQFYSYTGGISQCWRQKIKTFNRERHQGKKDVSNLNAGKPVWFVREVVQLERDFFNCLQGYLKILELILH